MTNTITLPRSVLEQALEALEMMGTPSHLVFLPDEIKTWQNANEALRAALEQPQVEQEPVAWAETDANGEIVWNTDSCFSDDPDWLENPIALYTHPQQPRQPLTEEEIAYCIFEARLGAEGAFKRNGSSSYRIARAIERAHGITGE